MTQSRVWRRTMSGAVLSAAAVLVMASGAAAQAEKPRAAQAAATQEGAKKLAVGDRAPELMVAKWIKGEPVTGFEKGKPYVVEFWATWCGPCKKSIPHLTELQKKHGDKVTIIGVSTSERGGLGPVEKFVEEWGPKMDYTVGFDEGNKMAGAWMRPAGLNTIPSAFIVDQQGRVAWIGNPIHPMGEFDAALELAVAGKLTPESSREVTERFRAELEKETDLLEKMRESLASGDHAAAVDAVNQLVALSPASEASYGNLKFRVLLTGAKDYDQAYAYGRKLVSGPMKDEPSALNEIAWTIVDPDNPVGKQDLDLALMAAQRADELTGGKESPVIDTLAKVYWDRGDQAKAIEIQERAVKMAKGTPFEEELTDRLAEYRKAANGGG